MTLVEAISDIDRLTQVPVDIREQAKQWLNDAKCPPASTNPALASNAFDGTIFLHYPTGHTVSIGAGGYISAIWGKDIGLGDIQPQEPLARAQTIKLVSASCGNI